MTDLLQIIFWLSVACVFYAYVGYPLTIGLLAHFFGRSVRMGGQAPQKFSIVVAAYNESATIAARVHELLDLLHDWPDSEFVLVSDGSTDGTLEAALHAARSSECESRFVPVRLAQNSGKAVALNTGVAVAAQPIIIFADARQTWTPQTIPRLLAPFADPDVGAVSGDLILQAPDGALAGVGLYWRMEKWLRVREGLIHSTIGATGAISAVRKALYEPLRPGTILDDVCWPAAVALAGKRVVHEPLALAYDHLPSRPRDEFRRKVRTLSGNLQLLQLKPQILRPWSNPILFGFLAKKLLRLAVPWAMLTALAASLVLPLLLPAPLRWVYLAAAAAQLALYALGAGALISTAAARFRIPATIASLLVLNAAAFCAFWTWMTGRCDRAWKKPVYDQVTLKAGSALAKPKLPLASAE